MKRGTKLINCTNHPVRMNDGTVIEPSGVVARTFPVFEDAGEEDGMPVFHEKYGHTIGLPRPQKGVIYVVSQTLLRAAKQYGRRDCLSPASRHPEAVRNKSGELISVPGFVK